MHVLPAKAAQLCPCKGAHLTHPTYVFPGSSEPAAVDGPSEEDARPAYELTALRREVARQDEVTRSLSAAGNSELRCITQLARTQVGTLCRTLGLRDYDADQAAKVSS